MEYLLISAGELHFGESFRKLRLDRVEFLQLAPVYLAKSVNVHVLSPWCGFELSFGYTPRGKRGSVQAVA